MEEHPTSSSFDPIVAQPVNIIRDLEWPPEEPYQQSRLSSCENETGVCPICLEEHVREPTAVRTCGHIFCRACLEGHCKHHPTLPIACPFSPKCENHLPSDLIQRLVGPEIAKDYLKSYWLRHNKTLHECPVCQSLLSSPPKTDDFRCGSCRRISCRHHGRDHPFTPCHQWLQSHHCRATQQTDTLLRQWTKPCSHCGVRMQKAAGCDHVVCLACQKDMCWRCGTHEYLTGQMIRHCHKCHGDFRDHRFDRRYRLRLCLLLPVLLPFMIAYVVAALVMFLATGLFCCCFFGGACLGKDWPTGVSTAALVVFLPFVALLEDFGIHVPLLDTIFPELRAEGEEMPILSIGTSRTEQYIETSLTQEEEEEPDVSDGSISV